VLTERGPGRGRALILDVLVIEREITDLDNLEYQRRKRERLQRSRGLAVERLLPKAADENGDLSLILHYASLIPDP
jgi:hypothetical protein